MSYDLIIQGGTVVDGTGLPGYRADVGVTDGTITAIGDLSAESANEVIDAEGHVVAPGFIDGHTHMDAQLFWDDIGRNACWHGVTTVVMGNCGFSLAPCSDAEKNLVLHNFERAEDIPPEAMNEGIDWTWDSFPEFFDAVDQLPKGLNYAGYVGHSALRTHAMGQRAMEEQANEDDLAEMKRALADGMRAGAVGFSTSRTWSHRTTTGKPVASRLANWHELLELTGVLRDLGTGIVQLARENVIDDPDERQVEYDQLKELALDHGLPVTFGNTWYRHTHPDLWRSQVQLIDEIAAAGGKVLMQGTAAWNGSLRSFETMTPYDMIPVWKDFRLLPLEEQEAGLRDPEMRAKLVDAVKAHKHNPDPSLPNLLQRPVEWDWTFPLHNTLPPHPSVADIAAERGAEPIDVFLDLALEKHLKLFFIQPSHNQDQDAVLAMIRHPNCVVTFSDAGAHVATTVNPIHGHLLGHWVRNAQAITMEAAIRKITFDLAAFWGLKGRGWLREGYHADIVVFDPETIAPEMPELLHDLPAGAPRIMQKSAGIRTTIVNGQILMRNNEHSGAYPGQLLRGQLAHN